MLDCNEIFPESTACLEGVSIFVLENFHPVLQEDSSFKLKIDTGIFYEGDCYIVLNVKIILKFSISKQNLHQNIKFIFGLEKMHL